MVNYLEKRAVNRPRCRRRVNIGCDSVFEGAWKYEARDRGYRIEKDRLEGLGSFNLVWPVKF